ncbi:DUF1926 domain-containing protein [candidate division WOR-3 bacterium]|nr:DUF1926 domain-containing protein [candidate division WOR-3 bacterium]
MIRFIFGIHNHQPLGNLDWVIKRATEKCYIPFLEKVRNFPFFKFVIHISGVLIEWFEKNNPYYLELIKKCVQSGQAEILSGGYYEPVLSSIPKRDRRKQISLLTQYIKNQFGFKPSGIWLTERVWEPDLVEDIARSGIKYVVVDDRHFTVSGFDYSQLHSYYISEFNEQRISIFPIDTKLRYLIPFRQPKEIEEYIKKLDEEGHQMVIYIDDGEKFGEWPGTNKWVYKDGWLDQFIQTMGKLNDNKILQFSTFSEIIKDYPPKGIVYLSNASYMEMEEWALPARKIIEIETLKKKTGDSPFIRGGHWKNFFTKYSESNRMHKFMLLMSSLVKKQKNKKAEKMLLSSQCNDAYWHGVFGGLYLPHLRHATWKQLSKTLKILSDGMEKKENNILDFDYDGKDEIWIHSKLFSSILKPSLGGQLIQHILFKSGNNYQNTLMRRFESYHQKIIDNVSKTSIIDESSIYNNHEGVPSIHTIGKNYSAPIELFYDWYERNSFIDHFFSKQATLDDYEQCDFQEMGDFVNNEYQVEQVDDTIVLTRNGGIYESNSLISTIYLTKLYSFNEGNIKCNYIITNTGRQPINIRFGIEFNLFFGFLLSGNGRVEIKEKSIDISKKLFIEDVDAIVAIDEKFNQHFELLLSKNCNLFYFPLQTISQSEKGFDTTNQCLSFLPFWNLKFSPGEIYEVGVQWKFKKIFHN